MQFDYNSFEFDLVLEIYYLKKVWVIYFDFLLILNYELNNEYSYNSFFVFKSLDKHKWCPLVVVIVLNSFFDECGLGKNVSDYKVWMNIYISFLLSFLSFAMYDYFF